MIPKIESAVQTVFSGVGQVLIGDNFLTGTFRDSRSDQVESCRMAL